MADEVEKLSRRRVRTDLVAVVLGAGALLTAVRFGKRIMVLVGAYGMLLGTSTAVVTFCLTKFTGIAIETDGDDDAEAVESQTDEPGQFRSWWNVFTGRALETDDDVEEDTGWLIGRLENVLVLTLVAIGDYTALSIIFAAKSWVRREDTTSGNTTYYLAGTLVNFTYSIAVGMGLVWALDSV